MIRIDTIIPLTGQGASVGENVKSAVDLCVQNWNTRGGVNGKKIVVNHHDSQGLSKYGQMIANKIMLSYTPNIVLSGISGVSLSAQPILERNQVIHECIVSTDKIFSESINYTIRNYLSTQNICSYFMELLDAHFKKHRFGLIYTNTDYGLSFKEGFENVNSLVGSKGLVWDEVLDENNLDYKTQLYRLDTKSIDMIYVAARYQTLGRIIKQLRECGYSGLIVCDTHLNSVSALNIIGDNKSNLYYIDVVKSEKTDRIHQQIKEIYKIEPDNIALIAYNGIDLIISCMQQSNQYEGAQLMSALKDFQYNGILGNIKINNNDIILPLTLEKIAYEEY